MVDRSKGEKMLVWNNGFESDKETRIVIERYFNGGCLAVCSADEQFFELDYPFSTKEWDHCEPVSNKTKTWHKLEVEE